MAGEPIKPATKRLARIIVEFPGGADLLQFPLAKNSQPVSQGDCLGLIMGYVDHGGFELLLKAGNFIAHLASQFGVEIGERFVQQKDIRLTNHGPAHGHPLPLPA